MQLKTSLSVEDLEVQLANQLTESLSLDSLKFIATSIQQSMRLEDCFSPRRIDYLWAMLIRSLVFEVLPEVVPMSEVSFMLPRMVDFKCQTSAHSHGAEPCKQFTHANSSDPKNSFTSPRAQECLRIKLPFVKRSVDAKKTLFCEGMPRCYSHIDIQRYETINSRRDLRTP